MSCLHSANALWWTHGHSLPPCAACWRQRPGHRGRPNAHRDIVVNGSQCGVQRRQRNSPAPAAVSRSRSVVRVYLQPPGTTEFKDANPLDPFEFVRFRGIRKPCGSCSKASGQTSGVVCDAEPDSILGAAASRLAFSTCSAENLVGRAFTEEEVGTSSSARDPRRGALEGATGAIAP